MALDSAAMFDTFMSAEGAVVEPSGEAASARLQTTEEPAFHRLYERLAPALRAYLLRMCGHSDLADDFLQDVFIKYLCAPLPEMDEAATKAYLYRIATNLVTDHWRLRERERRWSWKAIFRQPAEPSLDLQGDMARQFGRLAPREQALLWLAYVEGFEHEEIAQILKVKPKSVRVLLFRARRRLGALLNPEGADTQ